MENIESNISPNIQQIAKSKYLFYEGKEALFHTRRINPQTNEVEVWECKWTNPPDGNPQKEFLKKVDNADLHEFSHEDYSTAAAICWAPGRTIGNIAVNSRELLGKFTGKSGGDAILPCQIIPCGKFRNGKERWYCKTHQVHWGTIADFAQSKISSDGEIECSSKNLKMNYVVNPFEIEFKDFEEIGIWCSMPKALSSKQIEKRAPKIHVHRRKKGVGKKDIDADFDALILSYDQKNDLFDSSEITKIQVTPPAALEFVLALEEDRQVSCVNCKKCRYPHLDLGDFARKPHKKHYCGNCGNDSVMSAEKIVSTPLKPLHDLFNNNNIYIKPDRELNLDEYQNMDFDVWTSTPAIIWTADRPQEKGIHVHVYDGNKRIVDDTFSKVIHKGYELDRKVLWDQMIKYTEGQ